MITSPVGLVRKAEQQIRPPAIVTDTPSGTWKNLLKIFAKMSSPPVEALMLKRIACAALITKMKQTKSNPGLATMTPCTS